MRVLLAVSGGIDSMYLATRASDFFPESEFCVAHCNFNLRGKESDGDEEFVREWCRNRGIECKAARFDTSGFAAANGLSIEMAARKLRYDWFAALCRDGGFDGVAVAHNANDNAETMILNLLRGTGTRGIRGMSEGRDTEYGLKILRPMLKTSREEISSWMKSHGIPWREDSTNAESVYKRNILRNEVFPVLSRMNPSFVRTLGEDMERFALVDDLAEDYYREHLEEVRAGEMFSADGIVGLKHWKYMLWRILENSGISYPTFGKMAELLERYRTGPRGTVTICGKSFETPSSVISIRRVPGSGPVLEIRTR